MTIDENGVPNTLSINKATHAHPSSQNATLRKEEESNKEEGAAVNNELERHELHEAESKQCETDKQFGTNDRSLYNTPEVTKIGESQSIVSDL